VGVGAEACVQTIKIKIKIKIKMGDAAASKPSK
jgi:hypothetical protein